MKNESVSALFTNKLDTLGADPRRRNWPRVLFMRWPRERGHVSLANFQVSDDIVGRSLGQIGGKERETERERQRERESLHHEDCSRRGERNPCCIGDTGRYAPSPSPGTRLVRHVEYVPLPSADE